MLSFALAATPEHTFSAHPALHPLTADRPPESNTTTSSSEDSTPSDFKIGFSHGWSKAKGDDYLKKNIQLNAAIRGAIYGGLDGFVFIGSYGFFGLFSASAHIIANNIYIYRSIDVPPLGEDELSIMSENVQRGYNRGYKTYTRLYKRGMIVSTGLVTLTTSTLIMLNRMP